MLPWGITVPLRIHRDTRTFWYCVFRYKSVFDLFLFFHCTFGIIEKKKTVCPQWWVSQRWQRLSGNAQPTERLMKLKTSIQMKTQSANTGLWHFHVSQKVMIVWFVKFDKICLDSHFNFNGMFRSGTLFPASSIQTFNHMEWVIFQCFYIWHAL